MELVTICQSGRTYSVTTEDGYTVTVRGTLKVYGDYVIIDGNMFYKARRVAPQ